MAARTWFVTGASSGFGRALAELLLDRGDNVVLAARRLELLEPLAATHPDRALALELDVTDAAAGERALDAARARFGAVDALVNNAGFGMLGTVEQTPVDAARAMMEVHLFGVIGLVRGVLPDMIGRGAGTIVNVGSVAGQIGFPGIAYYSASKFALAGLTEALAAEVAPLGIRVTLAELGPFDTGFTGAMQFSMPAAHYDMAALSQEAGNSHWGAGEDPRAAAAALLAALDAPLPPRRLVLGKLGMEVVERHDARRAAEREGWRTTSLLDGY